MSSFFGPTIAGSGASAPRRSPRRRRPKASFASRRQASRDRGPRAARHPRRSRPGIRRLRTAPSCPRPPGAGMADHHDLATGLVHLGDLDVDLGDQRARRVEHLESPRCSLGLHGLRDPVRGEDHGGPAGTSSSSSTKIAPWHAGRRRRSGCARPRGARRSGPRIARAPARRSRSRDRRRRRSRGDWRARRPSALLGLGAAHAEAVDDQQGRAHGDRAVGDVERRVAPLAPVEEQEVHDLSDRDPVPQVPQRAAEDQREARRSTSGCRPGAAARR